MTVQPFLIGEGWIEIRDGDPSLMDIFKRHYSYEPPLPGRTKQALAIGPGFKLALMTADGGAICTWRQEKHRRDKQVGVNCSIFRRERGELASTLIGSARCLAWQRWPNARLFTFINPRKVTPTIVRGHPVWGWCFYKDGWSFEGLTARGLHILARKPEAPRKDATVRVEIEPVNTPAQALEAAA